MHTHHLLVTVARDGEVSDGIVDRIAVELGRAGCDVELAPPGSTGPLDRYDAIVLGSEVVDGHWLADARALAKRIHDEAPAVPVWLFSSCVSDHPSAPSVPASDAQEPVALTGASDIAAWAASIAEELRLAAT